MSQQPIRVTVWNEFLHEKGANPTATKIYPKGIHHTIAESLRKNKDMVVRTATLEEPEHGLTQKVVDETDVMLWWGHMAHHAVSDDIVRRVQSRVLSGMGLIVLHSGHYSKIFRALMGTGCGLFWREHGERERVWTIEPNHPIAEGIPDQFVVEHSELYGERFDIPTPDKLIFVSWFAGGDVFRSGCCWERGHGKIFYFSPGHETYPIYHNETVMKVITNAVRWSKPNKFLPLDCPCRPEPVEKIPFREPNLSNF